MSFTKHKIVFAVGGSGGHILPAQEMAESCSKKGYDCFFMGVGLGNNPFLKKELFSWTEVEGSSLEKSKLLKAPFKILKGLIQSIKCLRKMRPNLVIGFGSYHSFPVMWASKILKIPYFLFEPNLEMGKVNALFSKGAKTILTYFFEEKDQYQSISSSKSYLKIDPVVAKQRLKFSGDKPLLLIFGGSQGAKFINDLIMSSDLKSMSCFHVYHLCGKEREQSALKLHYKNQGIDAEVVGFDSEMFVALSAANLAICRAGASTLVELIEYEIPALLIPYSFDEAFHQVKNAQFFENVVGGGKMLLQRSALEVGFKPLLQELILKNDTFKANIKKFNKKKNYKSADQMIESFFGEIC
jgi:UDP-N-acetylglucosamine--N-acetylmuramyl-(pentapeptide) pyrophosphoryl-undecaprenol N-acetylglucosamine transferase